MKLRELKECLDKIDEKYEDYDVTVVLFGQDEAPNMAYDNYDDRRWLHIHPASSMWVDRRNDT